MKIRFWGTRGSLATPGPDTIRYGGNTSCVEIREQDTVLVLDAGTGIRPLGDSLPKDIRRVDILLTHLHMDHIQGLGFFDPLFWPGLDVHIWGPSSTTLDLHTRLTRYLSPPLFPVRLRDLPCELTLHDVIAIRRFEIGPFAIQSRLVCHPGPTVGFRISSTAGVTTYLPDNEPSLGIDELPADPAWIPGIDLALSADILIHDAQFSAEQYPRHIGWGHSSIDQCVEFAIAAKVRRLVPFHHDPSHTDDALDRIYNAVREEHDLPFELSPAMEGSTIDLQSD